MIENHSMCLCSNENRCIKTMDFYVSKNIFKANLTTWKNVHGMLSGKSRIQHNKQYDANCVYRPLSLGLSHVTQAGLKPSCVAEEGLVLIPVSQGLG